MQVIHSFIAFIGTKTAMILLMKTKCKNNGDKMQIFLGEWNCNFKAFITVLFLFWRISNNYIENQYIT